MAQNLTLNSLVVATEHQVSTDLAGKKAILHLKNRTYYTLDDVGSPIWELLKEPRRVEDILQKLLQRYDVEPDQCQRDLLLFLQELADQSLLEVR